MLFRLPSFKYFITDMIGLQVVTDMGEDFGVLKDVLVTGANDVYVIEHPVAGEVLVPAIKECILEVDISGRKMKIHVMEGLL